MSSRVIDPPDAVVTMRLGSLSQTTPPSGLRRMYLYSMGWEPGSSTVAVQVVGSTWVSGTAAAGSQLPRAGTLPTMYSDWPGSVVSFGAATCRVTAATTVAPASHPSATANRPSAGTVAVRLDRLSQTTVSPESLTYL